MDGLLRCARNDGNGRLPERKLLPRLQLIISRRRHEYRYCATVTRRTIQLDPMNPMPSFPPSATVLDSVLFRDAFGTPAMREVFSDLRLISRYAEVEVALAKAEARCGVIPAEAAEAIAARTDVSALDLDLLRRETDIVGYPILPLVHQIAKQ